MSDLWDERASLVPEGYRMLTLCLLKRPGFFRPSQVKQELQLEGYRDARIDNALAMLEGQRAVIDGYLTGAWTLAEHPLPPLQAEEQQRRPQEEARLDVEQTMLLNAIKDMVMWALERRYPEDVSAEELEHFMQKPLQQAPRQMRPLYVLGPAGSGKSTAVPSSHSACEPGRRACRHRLPHRGFGKQLSRRVPGLRCRHVAWDVLVAPAAKPSL